LLLDHSLGGVEDGASGRGSLHLGITSHRSHPLQSMDHLVGFLLMFIVEDICDSLKMLIRVRWLQGTAVQEVNAKFSGHRLELLVLEGS